MATLEDLVSGLTREFKTSEEIIRSFPNFKNGDNFFQIDSMGDSFPCATYKMMQDLVDDSNLVKTRLNIAAHRSSVINANQQVFKLDGNDNYTDSYSYNLVNEANKISDYSASESEDGVDFPDAGKKNVSLEPKIAGDVESIGKWLLPKHDEVQQSLVNGSVSTTSTGYVPDVILGQYSFNHNPAYIYNSYARHYTMVKGSMIMGPPSTISGSMKAFYTPFVVGAGYTIRIRVYKSDQSVPYKTIDTTVSSYTLVPDIGPLLTLAAPVSFISGDRLGISVTSHDVDLTTYSIADNSWVGTLLSHGDYTQYLDYSHGYLKLIGDIHPSTFSSSPPVVDEPDIELYLQNYEWPSSIKYSREGQYELLTSDEPLVYSKSGQFAFASIEVNGVATGFKVSVLEPGNSSFVGKYAYILDIESYPYKVIAKANVDLTSPGIDLTTEGAVAQIRYNLDTPISSNGGLYTIAFECSNIRIIQGSESWSGNMGLKCKGGDLIYTNDTLNALSLDLIYAKFNYADSYTYEIGDLSLSGGIEGIDYQLCSQDAGDRVKIEVYDDHEGWFPLESLSDQQNIPPYLGARVTVSGDSDSFPVINYANSLIQITRPDDTLVYVTKQKPIAQDIVTISSILKGFDPQYHTYSVVLVDNAGDEIPPMLEPAIYTSNDKSSHIFEMVFVTSQLSSYSLKAVGQTSDSSNVFSIINIQSN